MSNPENPEPPTWGPPGGQQQPPAWGQPGAAGQAGYGQPDFGQQGYAGPQGYPGQPAPYGAPGVDPSAPYGRDPATGEPYSDKQKLVAGLLQIFLGAFGAGRWYLGDNGIAIAQLLTCGGLGIWALIDGIMILTGNVRDKNGLPLRD